MNEVTTPRGQTILLVEDELPFRQIYRDILRLDGYKVVEAEDGEEALKMIESTPPDLVLLDIILPKLSGFDVLTKLKATPELSHIPVVVYSILNDKAEIDRALKLGANDFTIKGATPAREVLAKIKALLPQPPTATTTASLPTS